MSGLLLVYKLQLADRIFILPEGVFSAQLFNSYRTTRLTRGFGIQKASKTEVFDALCRVLTEKMRSGKFQASIASYIESYNTQRPHRTLKNLTPCQMEENFYKNAK